MDSYFLEDPILGCSLDSQNYIAFTGHTDGSIKMIHFQTKQTAILGKLPAPVKDVYWCPEISSLVAVTIDQSLTYWQTSNIGAPVFSIQLPHKTVVSAMDYPFLLLGSNDEKLCILRVDQPTTMNVNTYVDSGLGQFSKFMSAAVNAKDKGWLLCSMDGRGNYGLFRETSAGIDCRESVVCFKAQKKEEYNHSSLYQVNCCGFQPTKVNVIFVAGGEPSMIFFTAQKNGDKIKQYKYRGPVTAAKISPNGKYIAYALGNDWHGGINSISKFEPKIYVHEIVEEDINVSRR